MPFVLFCVGFITLHFLPAHADVLFLAPGAQISLPAPAPTAIKLQGRNIVSAQERPDHLILFGQKHGHAKIQIGHKQWDVLVRTPGQVLAGQNILAQLQNGKGLYAQAENNELMIAGQLLRLRDWQELSQQKGAPHFLFRAQVDSDIQPAVKDWLLEIFTSAQLPRPRLQWLPYPHIIVAQEFQTSEHLWRRACEPLGLEIKFEKSEIALEPLIRVNIVIAEVSKKAHSQMGVQWPDQIEAQLAPQWSGPQPIKIFLKGLEQKGLGQILASPNLLTRSGSEAEFLAGGEFPIKIITAQRREVVWKKHGIFLKIKPRADRSGHLSVELSTEISLIDNSQVYEGVPGLKTNRMSNHFDLSDAQTIILSGLIRNDWGENKEGIKGLSELPLLGRLFRSENYLKQKTELIIFVTPEIISEQKSEPPNLPQDWKNYDHTDL